MKPSRDNQGRDLDAFKRQLERDARLRNASAADAHQRHLEILKVVPYADWCEVEGTLCLRSGKSNFVAVPHTNSATPEQGDRSKLFDVISLEPREFVVQLKRGEVRNWLWRRHLTEKGL